MNLGDALKNLNEFFLEFLGYFLPGFTFIFLISILLKDSIVKIILDSIKTSEINSTFLFVFASYILGYIIYGINLYFNSFLYNYQKNEDNDENLPFWKKLLNKEQWIDKWKYFFRNHRKEIEKSIIQSKQYLIAKYIINSKFTKEETDLGFSGYRSIAMSIVGKENVQTIYTFMFRADLCYHLKTSCLIVGILGLIICGLKRVGIDLIFVNNSMSFLFFYIILIIIAYFLNRTSHRFLSIALRISFSMFLSKIYFNYET